ncbi:hypothetical protein BYT27DRAFT_7204873 [Phlegmacium glaucopus]|nr:hypothetical protein BYT27DRAFT_7204873 [Phlegmacium glaucopus]
MANKSFPSTYTLSLQSTNTVNSMTPLNTSTSQKPQKDYAGALGTLQSRYGAGGTLPSPKQTPSKKLGDNLTPSSESSTSSQTDVASLSKNSAEGSSTTTEDQNKGKKPSDSKRSSSFLKLLFKGGKKTP